MEQPCTRRSAISSRSANERYRPDSGFADGQNIAGGMPPASRNNLAPTGCDIPAWTAASTLAMPVAIAAQNCRCTSRPATGGRPGENNGARPDRSERRLRLVIATPASRCCNDHLSPACLPPDASDMGHFGHRVVYPLAGLTRKWSTAARRCASRPAMYRSNPESRGRPDLAHDRREDSVGPGNDDVVWSSPHASQRQADRSDIGLARSVPHRLADALWRQPCSERAPIIDVGINPPARGRDDYEAASPFPTNGGGERVDGPVITPGRPVWSSLVASLARWE
jgi:hypothetical protein